MMGMYVLKSADGIVRNVCAYIALHDSNVNDCHRYVCRICGTVQTQLGRRGISPADLTSKSRQVTAWLKLLSEADALELYVKAWRQAAELAGGLASGPVQIRFIPLAAIWHRRSLAGGIELRLPIAAIALSGEGMAVLVKSALTRGDARAAERVLLEKPCRAITLRLNAFAGAHPAGEGGRGEAGEVGIEAGEGQADPLAESYRRVLERYFAQEETHPALAWASRPGRWRFGSYDHVRDRILINRRLGQADVPTYVLDFVMYHELLHRQVGIRWGRRRGVHHAEFRAKERQFEYYERAEAALQALANGRKS